MRNVSKPQKRFLPAALIRNRRMHRIQQHIIALFILTLLIAFFLIGNNIITFAGAKSNQNLHKYYTSIQLQKGDSLWSLASEYAPEGIISRKKFISEVCRINGISENNTLHSGDYLVISYYSSGYPQKEMNKEAHIR